MKPREFHIWDFPEDKVRILMNDQYQKKFFKDCKEYFGSIKNCSLYLNNSLYLVQGWKQNNLFIPLWAIRKVIDKISWNWEEIEENIVSYKGINTSIPVRNPVLPIKESPKIFEIIAHLIGDGCVDKLGRPSYVNSQIELINNLRNSLKKCFGDVHCRLIKNKEIYEFWFSKIIADLITKFYDVKFDSYNAYFPQEIFKLPKEFTNSALRAIVDDEGHIRDNRIVISMKNKELISQIRKLLIKTLGQNSVSTLYSRDIYYWITSVNSTGLSKFQDKIKLIHPIKRTDLLKIIKKSEIRKNNMKAPVWNTKIHILKLLNNNELSIRELSNDISVNSNNINTHLKQLSNQGIVKVVKKVKYSNIRTITPEGLKFLETWVPSNKNVNINLPDWYERFNLPKKEVRILLTPYGRKRLFWMLERILKNQTHIGSVFAVHRSTISDWKWGENTIPLNILEDILIYLGKNGIDLTKEIEQNIQEIRRANGRYKIYEGDLK